MTKNQRMNQLKEALRQWEEEREDLFHELSLLTDTSQMTEEDTLRVIDEEHIARKRLAYVEKQISLHHELMAQ